MAHRVRDDHRLPAAADLLDSRSTLTQTNWAALHHAYGPAIDAPEILTALLDTDQGVRTKALDSLYGILHHQGTIYEATVPTAQYVAAILPDPRTTLSVDKTHRSFPGCIRADLLAWLGSVADSVTDAVDEVGQRLGFPLDDYPPAVAVREIRPLLLSAVLPYVDDSDRAVREGAIAACIPLLDDVRLLHHRAALVPLVHQVLGTSELWQHRERAIDALDAWGESSAGLEGQRNPFLFCDTDLSPDCTPWRSAASDAEGWAEDPPF
ncbi:hypothetical protein ACLQ18_06320 [Streptomyces sp. DT193]|uniref:hypothetical protein n=1 Tax=Streptomyces sp. DT193 TaxID=3393418 RepID=UPI003CF22551